VPLPEPKIRAGTSRDKRSKGPASQPIGDARTSQSEICAQRRASIGTRSKCGINSSCYQTVTEGADGFTCAISNYNGLERCPRYGQPDRTIGNIGLPCLVSWFCTGLSTIAVDITGFSHERSAAATEPLRLGLDTAQKSREHGRGSPAGASARAVVNSATVETVCSSRRVFAGAKPRSTIWSSRVRNVVQ
jgi:hypothetical protein